jgi:hypothetical protein
MSGETHGVAVLLKGPNGSGAVAVFGEKPKGLLKGPMGLVGVFLMSGGS